MNLGMLRGTGTLVLLLSFVVLCAWAWRPARRQRFDEAARLPFLDEEDPVAFAPLSGREGQAR